MKTSTLTFKVIRHVTDWVVFLVLGVLAIASTKGSWDAFSKEKTSQTIEQRPIPYNPTFLMCFRLSVVAKNQAYLLDLGKDFTMSLKTSPGR